MIETIATATFRPITPEDRDFLCQLYASTREEELALVDWSDQEKQSFLEMQFQAQHTFYMEQFKRATFDIIQLEGEPIGRLYLDRRPEEIRIIDIALMPDYRNRGIGTQLLQEILAEAGPKNLPVRIHVEQYNRALRLYQRLGFQRISDEGVYYLMERSPKAANSEQ